MTIINKTAHIIISSTLVLILVLYGAANNIIFKRFVDLENKMVTQSVNRASYVLNKEIIDLNSIVIDWAAWDESYKFVQDINEGYIKSNLVDSVFDNLKINFMIFVDNNGKIVYGKYFDLENKQSVNRNTASLQEFLNRFPELAYSKNINDKKSGIIIFSGTPILVSAAPITTSSFSGPIKGKLIMGRVLSNNLVRDISKQIDLKVSCSVFSSNTIEGFEEAKRFFEKNDGSFIRVLSGKEIEGYTLIKDITGKPAIILKVYVPREVYAESLNTKRYFLISLLIVSIGFIAVIIWILKKRVLLPSIQQEALLNTIPAAVTFKDINLKYVTANKLFIDSLNMNEKKIKGKSDFDIFSKEDAERIYNEDKTIIGTGITKSNLVKVYKNLEGKDIWISVSKSPYFDDSGRIKGIVTIGVDITKERQMEEKFYQSVYYDQLTSLPNRILFFKYINDLIARCKQNSSSLALLCIDFNRFKLINDTIGHEGGDKFLKDISEEISSCLNENNILARLGGDEFAILIPNVKSDMEVIGLCEKILSTVNSEWAYNTETFHITTGMGIALYPNHGEDGASLLKNAEAATHYAKEIGKNHYIFYNSNLGNKALMQVSMETSIRRAINKNEFELYYQAQVDSNSGKITGVEALIRWNDPKSGMIPPQKFIPFAEQSDLIFLIDRWVFRSACMQSKILEELNLQSIRIALNISSKHFEDPGFIEYVKGTLAETKTSPEWLELEITEGALMKQPEKAIKVLKELKEMGMKIALDDFGTGYSSLGYLKKFPIDKLKIDKSFVKDITEDLENTAIVKTIIDLAKNMGLTVLAEGVETREQLEILKQHGCDEVQGYLFSRPATWDEIVKILTRRFDL